MNIDLGFLSYPSRDSGFRKIVHDTRAYRETQKGRGANANDVASVTSGPGK